MHQLKHFLNDEDIATIFSDPIVTEKREKLNNNSVCFQMNLPDKLRGKLESLGITLSDQVPMRWIQGDTPEHADTGIQGFKKTHLIYLTDSAGKLCIGDEEFPIERGCGYVFEEGLRHSTRGAEPRLMIGPMSELGFQVGGSNTLYLYYDGGTQFFTGDSSGNIYYTGGGGTFKLSSNRTTLTQISNNEGACRPVVYNGHLYFLIFNGLVKIDLNNNSDVITPLTAYPPRINSNITIDSSGNIYYISDAVGPIVYKIEAITNSITPYITNTAVGGTMIGNTLAWSTFGIFSISTDNSTMMLLNEGIPPTTYPITPSNLTSVSISNIIINASESYIYISVGTNTIYQYIIGLPNTTGVFSSYTLNNSLKGGWLDGDNYFYAFDETLGQIVSQNPSPPIICFKQDTKILCQIDGTDKYIPVQTLQKGTLIKTLKNKYVPVDIIGSSKVYNSGNNERVLNRLYRLPKVNYPSLKEDLIMTGGHCSLIDIIPSYELRQKLIEKQGDVFLTEGKYRLPALLDEKAIPYDEKGNFTIWNFALENKDQNSNYGIYANGLLVESGFHKSIKRGLKPL